MENYQPPKKLRPEVDSAVPRLEFESLLGAGLHDRMVVASGLITGRRKASRYTSHQRNSYCPCGAMLPDGRRRKGKDCCFSE